jgi:hypothetical protein
MPKPVAISKFLPALLIPDSDQSLLQELALTLVNHNLEQYNNLCVNKDGRPDSRLWMPHLPRASTHCGRDTTCHSVAAAARLGCR